MTEGPLSWRRISVWVSFMFVQRRPRGGMTVLRPARTTYLTGAGRSSLFLKSQGRCRAPIKGEITGQVRFTGQRKVSGSTPAPDHHSRNRLEGRLPGEMRERRSRAVGIGDSDLSADGLDAANWDLVHASVTAAHRGDAAAHAAAHNGASRPPLRRTESRVHRPAARRQVFHHLQAHPRTRQRRPAIPRRAIPRIGNPAPAHMAFCDGFEPIRSRLQGRRGRLISRLFWSTATGGAREKGV